MRWQIKLNVLVAVYAPRLVLQGVLPSQKGAKPNEKEAVV